MSLEILLALVLISFWVLVGFVFLLSVHFTGLLCRILEQNHCIHEVLKPQFYQRLGIQNQEEVPHG